MIKQFFLCKAPAKLILFGEHSVLFGSKCISIAIKKYGRLEIREGQGHIYTKDNKGNFYYLNEKLDFKFPRSDLILEIDIPLACGLGTSAITSLLLSTAMSYFDKELPDKLEKEDPRDPISTLRRRAISLEQSYHGISSGADVTTSYFGGMVCFNQKLILKMNTFYLKNFKILIWYSQMTKLTKDVKKNRTSIHDKLGEVAEEAFEILQGKFFLSELYPLIRKSQDLLEEMGVVPLLMKEEVRRLRKMDIESKLSGAGNGGHLMTLVRKDQQINGWEEVLIDEDGLTLY